MSDLHSRGPPSVSEDDTSKPDTADTGGYKPVSTEQMNYYAAISLAIVAVVVVLILSAGHVILTIIACIALLLVLVLGAKWSDLLDGWFDKAKTHLALARQRSLRHLGFLEEEEPEEKEEEEIPKPSKIEIAFNSLFSEKKSKAAIKISSFTRGYLARLEFKKLEKKRRIRNQVIKEMVDTERSYVDSLKKMVDLFLRPIQQEDILSREQTRAIFSDIEIILNYNSQLLLDLDSRYKEWSNTQTVGDIFLGLVPFLKVYVQYVNNYNTALKTMSEVRQKNKDFNLLLLKVATDIKSGGLDLASYLIMPIQRIPRYKLLISEFLKHTWLDHKDYDNLKKALDHVDEVAVAVNEKKREAENISKVLSIQEQFTKLDRNLAQASRRFVMEGPLFAIPRGDSAKGRTKGTKLYGFLFNDLLVLATIYRRGSMFGGSKSPVGYKYHSSFEIDTLTDIAVLDECSFRLWKMEPGEERRDPIDLTSIESSSPDQHTSPTRNRSSTPLDSSPLDRPKSMDLSSSDARRAQSFDFSRSNSSISITKNGQILDISLSVASESVRDNWIKGIDSCVKSCIQKAKTFEGNYYVKLE